ncbi:FkbM family methyltransferase [Chamaesiphon sp.]|uniref:FkbM family methyltransferase n=1 Tax=Chamaesiphon sp. TaxID=2814140 RepID=UPI0035940BB4
MLIQRVLTEMNPVHGNSVFITFSNHQDLPALDRQNIHLAALLSQLNIQKVTSQQSDPVDELKAVLTQLEEIGQLLKTEKDIFYDIRAIGYLSRSVVESSCRKAFQSSYLGDDTLLCRVLTKYFCYVDATDISLTPHLLLNGYWEIWITQLLSRTIEPGWNCIDIGANCGYYTLLMADLVGSSGRVLAVEPNQKLASLVDRSVRVNGFKSYVEVSDKAASNHVGDAIQLCVPNGLLGDSTIHYPDKSNLQNTSSQYFSIITTTIDELVDDWSHVNFIKIDAEGAEWLIWQGMQETLSKNLKLTIILEFANYRPTYYDPREFLTEIVKAGFSLNYVDDDSMIKSITFDECLADKDGFIDLVLIR